MKLHFHAGLHKPNNCLHGPQVWEWWRLLGYLICTTTVAPPSTGYRLWLYTRWWAVYLDITFDRRKP